MNRLIFFTGAFLTLLPYPYYFYLSFFGYFSRKNPDLLISKTLKDILIVFMIGGILAQFENHFKKKALLWMLLLAAPLCVSLAYTLGMTDGLIRVVLGLRSLSFYFIPFIFSLIVPVFKIPRKSIALLFWVAVILSCLHIIFLHIGVVASIYKSQTPLGNLRRAYSIYSSPNLMGAIYSLIAVYFFHIRKYKTFLICLGLSLLTFSLTSIVPFFVYPLFLLISKNTLRSKLFAITILFFIVIILPFSAGSRFKNIIVGRDISAHGKVNAYIKTYNLLIESTWYNRLFGHGFSINDAAGAYLIGTGHDVGYFAAESSYNMLVTQYGIIFLIIYLTFLFYTLILLQKWKHKLSMIFSVYLISVSIMSLALQYFSFAPITVFYGFIQGLLFNPNRNKLADEIIGIGQS